LSPAAVKRRRKTGFKSLPLSSVYRLIEPGPVVLLATAQNERANVMAMSWHMMVEFEPPLVACVVSDNDFSFAALNETGECVIAIPGAALAKKVVAIGNCSGRDTEKFTAFHLAPARAKTIAVPLIADCFANLECKVRDRRLVKDYCLFVLEVTQAWVRPGEADTKTIHYRGYGTFTVDGRTIALKSRMR
jgi:flavin reductase (DIM6/NTAB) family NADH-FMN oxidoreductase RutF